MRRGPAIGLLDLILRAARWLMARRLLTIMGAATVLPALFAAEYHLGLVAAGLLPVLLSILLYKVAVRGPLRAHRDQDARTAMLASRFVLFLFPTGSLAVAFGAFGLLFATAAYLDSLPQPPDQRSGPNPPTEQL